MNSSRYFIFGFLLATVLSWILYQVKSIIKPSPRLVPIDVGKSLTSKLDKAAEDGIVVWMISDRLNREEDTCTKAVVEELSSYLRSEASVVRGTSAATLSLYCKAHASAFVPDIEAAGRSATTSTELLKIIVALNRIQPNGSKSIDHYYAGLRDTDPHRYDIYRQAMKTDSEIRRLRGKPVKEKGADEDN